MCGGIHYGEVEGLVFVERLYCMKKFEKPFTSPIILIW